MKYIYVKEPYMEAKKYRLKPKSYISGYCEDITTHTIHAFHKLGHKLCFNETVDNPDSTFRLYSKSGAAVTCLACRVALLMWLVVEPEQGR